MHKPQSECFRRLTTEDLRCARGGDDQMVPESPLGPAEPIDPTQGDEGRRAVVIG